MKRIHQSVACLALALGALYLRGAGTFQNDMLAAHNAVRAKVGVRPLVGRTNQRQ